jgi:hypothetical protein
MEIDPNFQSIIYSCLFRCEFETKVKIILSPWAQIGQARFFPW